MVLGAVRDSDRSARSCSGDGHVQTRMSLAVTPALTAVHDGALAVGADAVASLTVARKWWWWMMRDCCLQCKGGVQQAVHRQAGALPRRAHMHRAGCQAARSGEPRTGHRPLVRAPASHHARCCASPEATKDTQANCGGQSTKPKELRVRCSEHPAQQTDPLTKRPPRPQQQVGLESFVRVFLEHALASRDAGA
jgi:hypothetical protein